MTDITLLVAFWIAAFVVVWGATRYAGSPVARLALTWIGPFPRKGERKSSYFRRKAGFALTCLLVQILLVAGLALFVTYFPALSTYQTAIRCIGMFLMAGTGMALLGTLLAGYVSLFAFFLGSNPRFDVNEADASAGADPHYTNTGPHKRGL